MPRAHRAVVAAATVGALAAAGTVTAVALTSSSVDAWTAGDAAGDGLDRFVVTFDPTSNADATAAAEPPAPAEGALAGDGPAGTAPVDDAPALDLDLPEIDPERLSAAQDELGPGGSITVSGGAVVYAVDERWRVVSDLAAEIDGPQVAARESRPGALAQVAGLESVPGVDSAQRLSDGRVLVATSLDRAAVERLEGVGEVEESVTVPVSGAAPSALGRTVVTEPASATAPDDPLFDSAWHLHNASRPGTDVGALAGWEGSRGEGAVVAVVDTGFDSDHPDLQGSLWVNPRESCGDTGGTGVDADGNGKVGDCHGWNFIRNSADVDNGSAGWHGTAVAGAAGARAGNGSGAAGIAPEASLMPLVVGHERGVDVFLAAEAIRYAADNGADVVNASFGGPMPEYAAEHLRSAIAYAASRGVVVVAAAGNDSADRDSQPVYPASFVEPNLLTVGSSTSADGVAGHSAYGARTVDLFAPGERIVAPTNSGGYSAWNGTSLAAPLVAGAVALHRSIDPQASPAEVATAVRDGASRAPAFEGRSLTGARLSVAGLGDAGAGVRFTFTGAGRQVEGAVSPTVEIQGAAPVGSYQAVVALGMRHEGQLYAVSGVDLGLGVGETDDDGAVTVDLGDASLADGVTLGTRASLPAGEYVLLAQLVSDGEPVTRAHVAPLVVVPASPGTDPGGPGEQGDPGDSGDSPDSGGSPDSGAPGTPGTPSGPDGDTPRDTPPGGTGGTGGSGGTGDGPATEPPPGTPDPPPAPGPDEVDDTEPRTPAPGSPSSGGGDGTGGSSDAGGDGSSGSGSAGGGSGSSGSEGGGSSPGGSGSGSPGGSELNLPGDDAFGVTRIAPTTVSSAGGDLVRIEGRDIPSSIRVRVGTTGVADVVGGSTGAAGDVVTVRLPARVPGEHDLTLSTPDGRLSVFDGALSYVADGGSAGGTPPGGDPGQAPNSPVPAPGPGPADGPEPPQDGGGGSDPAPGGSGDGQEPGSAPAPGSPTPPPQDPGPGETGDTGSPGEPGSPSRPAVIGPGGLRLVGQSPLLEAIPAAVWERTGCETGCDGLPV